MEMKEYDSIIRDLLRIAANQDTITRDLRESMRQQHAFNAQQLVTNDRLGVVIERLDARQAETTSLLTSLDTKYQRLDVSLTYVAQDLAQHTALLRQLADILSRHEATFARLGRLLDERLPPASGNGHPAP